MRSERVFNLCVASAAFSLYIVNRFSRLFPSIPYLGHIFRNHFNDYLGAVLFIAYVNLLLLAGRRTPCTYLPGLAFWALLCSLTWEGLAPLLLPFSTADWWDCLAYCLGMFTYWCLLRLFSVKPHRDTAG